MPRSPCDHRADVHRWNRRWTIHCDSKLDVEVAATDTNNGISRWIGLNCSSSAAHGARKRMRGHCLLSLLIVMTQDSRYSRWYFRWYYWRERARHHARGVDGRSMSNRGRCSKVFLMKERSSSRSRERCGSEKRVEHFLHNRPGR